MPRRKRNQGPFLPGFRQIFRKANEQSRRFVKNNKNHKSHEKLFKQINLTNLRKSIEKMKRDIESLSRIEQSERMLGERREAKETAERAKQISEQLNVAEKILKKRLKERKKSTNIERAKNLEKYATEAKKLASRGHFGGREVISELNRFLRQTKKGNIKGNDIKVAKGIIMDMIRTSGNERMKKEIEKIKEI